MWSKREVTLDEPMFFKNLLGIRDLLLGQSHPLEGLEPRFIVYQMCRPVQPRCGRPSRTPVNLRDSNCLWLTPESVHMAAADLASALDGGQKCHSEFAEIPTHSWSDRQLPPNV